MCQDAAVEEFEDGSDKRGQRIKSVVGDNWETSAKSCGAKNSEHPGCTGRQVETSGRQA